MHRVQHQLPKPHVQGGQILNFNVGSNLDLRIPRVSSGYCWVLAITDASMPADEALLYHAQLYLPKEGIEQ